MKLSLKTFATFAVILVLGFLFYFQISKPKVSTSNVVDGKLAECLSQKGVKVYGAYWCSHCQDQKKLFGGAWEKINYIECSTADGKGQKKECQDAQITSYPTWEFADGERIKGGMTFKELSEKTGCPIE